VRRGAKQAKSGRRGGGPRRGWGALALAAAVASAAGLPDGARAQQPGAGDSSVIRIQPLPPPDRPGSPVPALRATSPATRNTGRALELLKVIGSTGNRVRYRQGFVRNVGVHVVEANMADPEVKVAPMLAAGGVGRSETFTRMMARARPAAAITGTFFGLNNREPTGDLVIDGRTCWRGFIGTALAITANNRVEFVPTRYKDCFINWSRYQSVMRGGPSLLAGREFSVAPAAEGFFSLGEFSRHWRTAVGLTDDNRLLLVAVRQSITLWELAKVMYSLGAWDAVALDGGTSTALYFGGKVVANPGRPMTNLLLIYSEKSRYQAMRPQLGAPQRTAARPAPPRLGPVVTHGSTDGSGFEAALPDPARPRPDAYRLDMKIEPAKVGR
jgi:hypothetical protein